MRVTESEKYSCSKQGKLRGKTGSATGKKCIERRGVSPQATLATQAGAREHLQVSFLLLCRCHIFSLVRGCFFAHFAISNIQLVTYLRLTSSWVPFGGSFIWLNELGFARTKSHRFRRQRPPVPPAPRSRHLNAQRPQGTCR